MPQDIRKWFMKQHEKGNGNCSAVKDAKPVTPEKSHVVTTATQPGKVVPGVQECSSRRKTSKYFDKDRQDVKDEMEVDEVPAKTKPPKVLKLEDNDEDEDFVTPSKKSLGVAPPSKKLKSSSGKGVAKKFVVESDEDDDSVKVKFSAKSYGRGRGAKVSSAAAKVIGADGSEEEDDDAKPVKSAGRGRGGRGVPATSVGGEGGRGGGRGGFNFGERKDPPRKGEKVGARIGFLL